MPGVFNLFGENFHARFDARGKVYAYTLWTEPAFIPVESIGDAAKKLTALGRNWSLVPSGHSRRAALLAEKLPRPPARPLLFGKALPRTPPGKINRRALRDAHSKALS